VPSIAPKKKKKKARKAKNDTALKAIKETATAGAVNVADFSNDFGTDSPRLPSERGDLTGKKSLGMGSGFTEYNLRINDPFTGKKYNLLNVLNTHGRNHAGGSTTQVPVVHSPWNEYVPSQEFILQQDLEKQGRRKKAVKHEKNTRKEHRALRDILHKAFIDSIQKPESITDDGKVKDQLTKGFAAANKTIGTDDNKE